MSNAGTGETSMELLNDRISLIAATTLLGVTYGVMFTLYCITTYSLLQKLFRRNASTRSGSHGGMTVRHKTIFYITYTSVLFILATLYTAGNSQNAIVAYVDNRSYPGGPYQYYVTYMAGQNVMVMTDITSQIILWMTDALILCRFIMFYYKVPYARWIIPLPCAMYVGVMVLSILVLQGEAGSGKIFYLSENMMLAYYALSFSLNVLATLLIASRLYWHKIQLERVFGSRMDTPYMSIATMLIESAALYGAWSLLYLILCVLKNPGQNIVLATMNQIQVIAPLLIILWMARGNAWNHANAFSEDVNDDGDITTKQPNASGSVGRLAFHSRSTRITGKFSTTDDDDDVRTDTDRDVSWYTVAGGERDERFREGGNEIDLAELGMGRSEPSSVRNDYLKA